MKTKRRRGDAGARPERGDEVVARDVGAADRIADLRPRFRAAAGMETAAFTAIIPDS